ncbi:MAG: alpha/beta hydrolase-fold protein [Planctomycetota bacterium]
MVRKNLDAPRGRVDVRWHDSTVLRGNALGDPHRREVAVYLPPTYDDEPQRRFPVLFDLAAFTSSGLAHIGWKNFQENLPERLDRLRAEGVIGDMIVVFPDAFTSLGGNQYVNSSAVGNYADYLVAELVPTIDDTYRTLPGARHRGVFGKSSGGYAALMHGMQYPDTWGAVACHSGDLYFEFGLRRDLPILLDVLARYDRSVPQFLQAFRSSVKPRGEEIHALMLIAMAASYDPDPTAELGFHLPLDLYTGELDEERWQRWLRFDPIECVADHVAALEQLRLLYVECGSRDQYYLHYGARILHKRLEALGVRHQYVEFDDNHSGIDYRLDESLPLLYRAVAPE